MTASSYTDGKNPELAANENVQNWWQAASTGRDEWLMMDLGKAMDVRAVQINFADDDIRIPVPGKIRGTTQARYIEEAETVTQYLLEGSVDGEDFFVLEDKTQADTDLSHDFLVYENGIELRYIRISNMKVPYDQNPCISGMRVFGKGVGDLPEQAGYEVVRSSGIDMEVMIKPWEKDMSDGTTGYNILWGLKPDKLYHSYLTYDSRKRIGALVKGESYYVRVDSFNENGITEGQIQFVEDFK